MEFTYCKNGELQVLINTGHLDVEHLKGTFIFRCHCSNNATLVTRSGTLIDCVNAIYNFCMRNHYNYAILMNYQENKS